MADALRIFVGPRAALVPFKAVLAGVRCYVLTPDAELAVLPFDDEMQDMLHDRFGTGDWPEDQAIALSTTDQTFAAECSQHAPLAYVQCDEVEGALLQSAAVWQLGQATVGPVTLDLSGAGAGRSPALQPMNIALRALGVVARDGTDERTSFGLAEFTSNVVIHARGWPLRV